MSIIKTHDITLYGSTGDYDIIMHPLRDEHLPLLYKWNSDPEVLYWTEGGRDIVRSYDPDAVHAIYGGVSQDALCFLIEVNGDPVGECWLQKMNLPEVKTLYPFNIDVRRIDMAIGEKSYWGKGIGTRLIGMLIDYAFYGEGVDVLHCFSVDYNTRSWKIWEKHRFTKILEEALPQPQKGKCQYHYRLTRQKFIENHRAIILKDKIFMMPLSDLQPSQLYISEGKLRLVREWLNVDAKCVFDPIPIKKICGRTVMTDGHSRAVAAYITGRNEVPVYWDEDELDVRAYEMDLKWCDENGIKSPIDLCSRIVSHKEYENLWRKRCMEMILE